MYLQYFNYYKNRTVNSKNGIVICGTFCENPQRFFDNNTYAQCTNNL